MSELFTELRKKLEVSLQQDFFALSKIIFYASSNFTAHLKAQILNLSYFSCSATSSGSTCNSADTASAQPVSGK
jgi:hypothetical protein